MNINEFLSIYTNIAKQETTEEEVDILFKELSSRAIDTSLEGRFAKAEDRLDKVIAIDAVAHEMHSVNPNVYHILYPESDVPYSIVKGELDNLSLMEDENEIRKANRDYFTTLLSDPQFVIISKQAGKTTKQDISGAVREYEALFNAEKNTDDTIQMISNAELLTLYRYSKDNKYLDEINARNLSLTDSNRPMVVAGYASVENVDKEGHLITLAALGDAFERFMKSFRTRNNMLVHSDVQTGWILPAYINNSGEVYKSGIDGKGLYIISEVRDDTGIAQRMAKDIEDGNIRSYSIAGNATKKQFKTKGSKTIMQVDGLDLAEVTFCEKPVNQKAHFDIIKSEDIPDVQLTKLEKNPKQDKALEFLGNPDIVKSYDDGDLIVKSDELFYMVMVDGTILKELNHSRMAMRLCRSRENKSKKSSTSVTKSSIDAYMDWLYKLP